MLLMGDSFIRHLSTGNDGHGAGVRDHLSAELGFPIDALSMDGGGANKVRIELAMDDGRLDDKKVVVWCFLSTSLMYGPDGGQWKFIPLPKSN